jgi:DNA-binding response OmpR family regulator
MAKKKILIVDDEKDILLMLEKRLIAEGYSVLTADNGKDAVTIAKSKSPDLIILDVLMPGMDGSEVAERLKDNFRTQNIPIIFLTALLTRKEEHEKNRIVADNITFAKPFDPEELLDEIKMLVETAAI